MYKEGTIDQNINTGATDHSFNSQEQGASNSTKRVWIVVLLDTIAVIVKYHWGSLLKDGSVKEESSYRLDGASSNNTLGVCVIGSLLKGGGGQLFVVNYLLSTIFCHYNQIRRKSACYMYAI